MPPFRPLPASLECPKFLYQPLLFTDMLRERGRTDAILLLPGQRPSKL